MEINKEKLRSFLMLVSDKTNIGAMELIEKDFYLNILLSKLNFEGYAFKGGTCLAKSYFDYFRFSEDLDFTFKDQNLWNGKSVKSIKKVCKEKIDLFAQQLEEIGPGFKFDKRDRDYIQIGNNNQLVTFKIHYGSIMTGNPSFIKIQINFFEKLIFPVQIKEIAHLIKQSQFTNEDQIYFKEFLDFYRPIKMEVYDIREIAVEKVRSLLTRKAIKSRDVIDLLFINNKFKVRPREYLNEIKEKIYFSINNYEKYKDNLNSTKKEVETFKFEYAEVKSLVIAPFKKEEFDDYVKELKLLLTELIKEF